MRTASLIALLSRGKCARARYRAGQVCSSWQPALAAIVAITVVLMPVSAGWAAGRTFSWKNPGSGAYSDKNNWTPSSGSAGTPGDSDLALFGVSGTYTVTGPGQAGAFEISGGDVTFSDAFAALAPHSLSVLIDGGALSLGGGSSLTGNGPFTIGGSGNGTLSLTGGASASASWGNIAQAAAVNLGYGAGSTGTLNIDGGGSRLTADEEINVGLGGNGVVSITNGGFLSSKDNPSQNAASAQLGVAAGTTGTMTVDGSGSTYSSDGQINIGGQGTGKLTVSGGGTVNAGDGSGQSPGFIVGFGNQSHGTLAVEGAGSTVTSNDQLEIGAYGKGAVTVNGGGSVVVEDDGSAYPVTLLGAFAGGDGTLTVTGRGSSLTSQGNFVVGSVDQAQGTVNVTDGGKVRADKTLIVGESGSGIVKVTSGGTLSSQASGSDPGATIGEQAGGSGTVTVAGDGSTYSSHGKMVVGGAGSGILTIDNNGQATVDGEAVFGEAATGDGSASVQGGGSLTVNDNLTIGENGTGQVQVGQNSTLTVQGDKLVLGENAGSNGELDLQSASSTLNRKNDIEIGSYGNGTLGLSSGAQYATQGDLVLGENAGASGTINASDTNTQLTVNGALTLGGQGAGNLNLSNNANAKITGDLVLGEHPSGQGNLILSDPGTYLDYGGGDIKVGASGRGAFTVSAGGVFDTSQAVTLGEDATGQGTLTVTGNGSEFTSGAMTVGENGSGNVIVKDGGSLISDLEIGGKAGSVGYGNVSGSGSQWRVDGDLTVGGAGQGTVNVQNNGFMTVSGATSLGEKDGGKGSVDVASGGGLEAGGGLTVGGGGRGDLVIDPGGYVSAGGSELAIGEQSTGVGTLTLNGAGAALDFSGEIAVGSQGVGTLALQGGAQDTLTSVKAATESGSQGTVNVTDIGSALTVTNELTIGEQGAGNLQVTSGGSLETVSDASLGEKVGAYGSGLVDSGGNLMVGGKLTVASRGQADLTVQGAGGLSADALTLGEHDGAFGSLTVGNSVTPDARTQVTITHDAEIGAEGAGQVTQYAGTLAVKGDLGLGGSADNPSAQTGDGVYDLNGGTVTADSLTVGLAGRGTFNLNDGTVNADSMTVGGGGMGTFNLNSGTLNDELIVGDAGSGQFNNTGGVHHVSGDLTLGNAGGGDGAYLLDNATHPGSDSLAVSDNAIVGNEGAGSFQQLSGQATIGSDASPGHDLILGQASKGNGTYTISGNSSVLNVGNDLVVGADGSGLFTQSNGRVAVGDDLDVGQGTGGSGAYALRGSGSTLNVTRDAIIGDQGQGGFTQSAGSNTVGNDLMIGGSAAADNRDNHYQLDGGSLTVGDVAYVGMDGNGSLTQTAGRLDAGYLDVGIYSGTGIYNLSAGTVTAEGDLVVGANGTNVAEFHQSGGTVNVDSSLFGMYVNGLYDLHGTGSLNTAHDQVVGDTADGQLAQTSKTATNSVGHDLILGHYSGVTGTYRLDAGQLSVQGDAHVGENGTGLFDQIGGSALIAGNVDIAANDGSTGTYNLEGGSLSADGITVHAQGVLHDSGGSLTLNGGNGTLQTDANGTVTLSGAGVRTINANVVNNGTVSVQDTSVDYTGTFTNNGAYISDPSTNTFTDLVIGQNGYLQGGSGDHFIVSGDIQNSSTQTTLWNTRDSTLEFTANVSHIFDLTGLDQGAYAIGYNDNFSWGDLVLDSGASLEMADGNTNNASTALYTALFDLIDGINQLNSITSAFNIYYDPTLAGNAYLSDASYSLAGGGTLAPIGQQSAPGNPVPEPGSLWLLASGMIGMEAIRRQRT